jgi:inner membrane protein
VSLAVRDGTSYRMPSPIAHTTMGYVIYKAYQARGPGRSLGQLGPLPKLLILTAGFSLLPDIDSIAGFLLQDFGRYHNSLSHSLFVGLVVAGLIGGLAWWIKRSGFIEWFAIAFLCYQFHIILDFFTVGRGVMLFWPLTSARFQSPVKLFLGLHWSDGLVSFRHVWTLLSELGFAVLVVLVMHFLGRCVRCFRAVRRLSNQSPKRAPEDG